MFKQGRPPQAGKPTTTTTTSEDPPSAAGQRPDPVPARAPGNELTRGTGAFVALLNITDLRYDISGFGGFLRDLPPRMGRNKALDASVCALTALFPVLHDKHVSSEMLASYGRALESLRLCLGDRVTAQTPETLSAIYLVTLCQVSTFLSAPCSPRHPL